MRTLLKILRTFIAKAFGKRPCQRCGRFAHQHGVTYTLRVETNFPGEPFYRNNGCVSRRAYLCPKCVDDLFEIHPWPNMVGFGVCLHDRKET